MRSTIVLFALLLLFRVEAALAQVSQCLAVANAAPPAINVHVLPVIKASVATEALAADEVAITFVGHSTFLIQSPEGVRIATDFAGFAGNGVIPDVVTMNHAHTSHYTDFPDERIKHVLRGWNPAGGAANHALTVKDVKIRNVPTDIRNWAGQRETDGNSIFIFETAGLCIGHLGHLHHELTPQHIGWIGRLDIVMVPVDGSYTMKQQAMVSVLKDLRSRIILPMHYFGPFTLREFVSELDKSFDVETRQSPKMVVSVRKLPEKPTVIVLPGY